MGAQNNNDCTNCHCGTMECHSIASPARHVALSAPLPTRIIITSWSSADGLLKHDGLRTTMYAPTICFNYIHSPLFDLAKVLHPSHVKTGLVVVVVN